MTAFVIGNGLSRVGIDLKRLKGWTYGCNSLYKEFQPTVLVACDPAISLSIEKSKYPKTHKFYTRDAHKSAGSLQLKTHYKNWASGPNALQLAVTQTHKEIVLLGFDFGSNDNKFNNVFAGTEFYKTADSSSTYTGSWETQISSIFKINYRVKFILVMGSETTSVVEQYKDYKNVELMDKGTFIQKYVLCVHHK